MFWKKYQKSSKNPPETCLESRKNQRKIMKNENKSIEKGKMSEENPKICYIFETLAKNDPTYPQEPPKESRTIFTPGLRVALSGPYLESKKL